jgi:hypothetical protein
MLGGTKAEGQANRQYLLEPEVLRAVGRQLEVLHKLAVSQAADAQPGAQITEDLGRAGKGRVGQWQVGVALRGAALARGPPTKAPRAAPPAPWPPHEQQALSKPCLGPPAP